MDWEGKDRKMKEGRGGYEGRRDTTEYGLEKGKTR